MYRRMTAGAPRRPPPKRTKPSGRAAKMPGGCAPIRCQPEMKHDSRQGEPASRLDFPCLRHPGHRRRHPHPGDRPVDRPRDRRGGAPSRRADIGRRPRRTAFEHRAARGSHQGDAGERPRRHRHREGADPAALFRGGASRDRQRRHGHRQPQPVRVQRTEDRDRRRDAAQRCDPGSQAPDRGERSRTPDRAVSARTLSDEAVCGARR